MIEIIALILAVITAVLARTVLKQRDRLVQSTEALSRARVTLNQKQSAIAELETSLKARDAAIRSFQNPAPVSVSSGKVASAPVVAPQPDFTGLMVDATDDVLLIIDNDMRIIAQNSAARGLFPDLAAGSHSKLSEITQSASLIGLVENTFAYEDELIEEQVTFDEQSFLVHIRLYKTGREKLVGIAMQDISQLVRLNRARRDMVANISHELRHPIANIRLIIDGLFHEHDKPKRKDSIFSLRAIAHETDLLLWLVQSMADLSMIETGQAIVRMVDVNFNELVDGAIERLMNQTERKRMSIVRHIPAKLHVLCDRDLIQRVVINLLHNAIKWSPEGGAVTIEAEISGEEVIVSVRDNGPGVPADQVERIFERFYQVDPSRSGKEGTGLGLAICKHIVTAHGGRIWAEGNQMGSGGKFRFTLLNADLSAGGAKPAEEDALSLPSETPDEFA